MTNRCSIPVRGACLALTLTVTACGHDEVTTGTDQSAVRTAISDDHTVTLITGDRVTLRNSAPLITPGPGRTNVKFAVQNERDHVRVVPDDVAPLIAADQVDISLFDITLLLESGYSD